LERSKGVKSEEEKKVTFIQRHFKFHLNPFALQSLPEVT